MFIEIGWLALGLLLTPATVPEPSVTTIPFEFAGNHTFIEVVINDRELSFVFDTGANGNVINEVTARRLGIESVGSGTAMGAAGSFQIALARGVSISIGGLRLSEVGAALVPLGHLEEALGRPIDGIIGRELMDGRIVVLDYERNVIELHARERFPFESWGQPCAMKTRGLLRVDGAIRLSDGESIRGKFYIDSGAGMFLDLNSTFVRKHALEDRVGRSYAITGRALTGVAIPYRVGRIDSLSFCGHEFPGPEDQASGLPVRLSGATSGVQAANNRAGLIGNAILRRFNFVFDSTRQRMYLKPNRTWGNAIRTDASGLRLIKQANGAVLISEIVAGSSAALVGLAAGDQLLSIDGADAISMPLAALRTRLKQLGKTFSLEIVRDGTSRKVVLEPRSLFEPVPIAE
jgi:hypothetical protein